MILEVESIILSSVIFPRHSWCLCFSAVIVMFQDNLVRYVDTEIYIYTHTHTYIFVNLEIYIAESFIKIPPKLRDFGNPTIFLED